MNKTVNFTPVKIGILVLGLATAFIHLVVLNAFIYAQTGSIDTLFTLNGIGYLALVTAYLLPQLSSQRVYIRWFFVAFTAVTIIAWFLLGNLGDPLGIITKIIEAGLIVLLIIDGRR